MKIEVRGTPDEIETLALVLRSNWTHVRSVNVSQVYKASASNKTGWAWITIVFSDLAPSRASIEIYRRRRPRRGKPDTEGYVYLIKAGDSAYKIGKTIYPKSRLHTFEVKLPFEVESIHLIQTDDMDRLEFMLHRKFAAKRLRDSEFFALDDSDVQFIISLGDTYSAANCARW